MRRDRAYIWNEWKKLMTSHKYTHDNNKEMIEKSILMDITDKVKVHDDMVNFGITEVS